MNHFPKKLHRKTSTILYLLPVEDPDEKEELEKELI